MSKNETNPIRRARQACGMTQQELGDRVGVSKATVSKWETGDGEPQPAEAVALTQIFRRQRLTLQAIYRRHLREAA